MARKVFIESELKKADLIKIIIDGKVPEHVEISDEVTKYIESGISNEHIDTDGCRHALGKHNLESEIPTMGLKYDLKIARLIKELERTISNQETIICLLKNRVNFPEYSHVAGLYTNNIMGAAGTVSSRGVNKKPVIWGCNETPQETTESQDSFAAAARKAWLYVGHVRRGTNPDQIKGYLTKKFSNSDFTVEPLPA